MGRGGASSTGHSSARTTKSSTRRGHLSRKKKREREKQEKEKLEAKNVPASEPQQFELSIAEIVTLDEVPALADPVNVASSSVEARDQSDVEVDQRSGHLSPINAKEILTGGDLPALDQESLVLKQQLDALCLTNLHRVDHEGGQAKRKLKSPEGPVKKRKRKEKRHKSRSPPPPPPDSPPPEYYVIHSLATLSLDQRINHVLGRDSSPDSFSAASPVSPFSDHSDLNEEINMLEETTRAVEKTPANTPKKADAELPEYDSDELLIDDLDFDFD